MKRDGKCFQRQISNHLVHTSSNAKQKATVYSHLGEIASLETIAFNNSILQAVCVIKF